MAQKLQIECPRCDGKGVLPQYYYNRKGICFLCWGAKVITVKVPEGKTKDEYIKELKERERKDLTSEKNKPKVSMVDKDKHRNKDYWKGANSKIKAGSPSAYVSKMIGKLASDENATSDDWKKLLAELNQMPDYEDKKQDIATIEDAIKLLEEQENLAKAIDKDAIRKHMEKNLKGNLSLMKEILADLDEALKYAKGREYDEAVYKMGLLNQWIKEAEEEAKANHKPKATGDRIGRIVKGVRGKPDLEIVGQAGTLNVGKFTNSKTGETNYVIFPENKIEDWDKFKKDIKDNIGGAYSRYMAKPIFDENPTDKLIEWVENGNGEYGESTPDTDKDRKREQRRLEREARGYIDSLFSDYANKWNSKNLQEVYDKIKAMPDFDNKETMLKEVESDIQKAIADEKVEASRKPIKDILAKYPDIYDASSSELAELQKELEALPQSTPRDEAIAKVKRQFNFKRVREIVAKYPDNWTGKPEDFKKLIAELQMLPDDEDGYRNDAIKDANIDLAVAEGREKRQKAKAEKEKEAKELEAEYDKKVAERTKRLVEYDVASKIKDTELGKQVKERMSKGINTDADVIEVGKLVADEYEKQLAGSQDKLNEKKAERRAVRDEFDNFHDNVYMKELLEGATPERMDELQKQLDEILARKHKLDAEVQKLEEGMADIRENAFQNTMKQIREMGLAKGQKINTDGEQNVKKYAKVVEQHLAYYPREWVEASNELPMEVRFVNKKKLSRSDSAHYSHGYEGRHDVSGGEIKVIHPHIRFNKNSGKQTYTHELGHRMESIHPKIFEMQKQFYERRTEGSALKWLGGGYAQHEKYRPINDKWNGLDWNNVYMGKEYKYGQNHVDYQKTEQGRKMMPDSVKAGDYYGFELLTMGMENIVHGARYGDGNTIVENDKEMMAFIFGMLATL